MGAGVGLGVVATVGGGAETDGTVGNPAVPPGGELLGGDALEHATASAASIATAGFSVRSTQ